MRKAPPPAWLAACDGVLAFFLIGDGAEALLGGGRFVRLPVGVAATEWSVTLPRIAATGSAAQAEGQVSARHGLMQPTGYLVLGVPGNDASAISRRLQLLSSAQLSSAG